MNSRGRRTGWIEQLTLYLPVVIMGILALGTWWLVRSSPQAKGLDTRNDNFAGPQYHIQAFTTQSFDAHGRLNAQVSAQFAQYDGQTDTLLMQQVRLRSVDEQGQLMLAEANKANASNALDRFTLQGSARVWQSASDGVKAPVKGQVAWVFMGEHLELDGQTKQLRSQGPARLQRGKDSLSAEQMQYDDINKRLSMDGRVRAVFNRSTDARQQ
jgi:lipopolysaccharide export system protein LptC